MTDFDKWVKEEKQGQDAAREAAAARLVAAHTNLTPMVERNLVILAQLRIRGANDYHLRGRETPVISIHNDPWHGWRVNLPDDFFYRIMLANSPQSSGEQIHFVGGEHTTRDTSEGSLQELLKAYYPNPDKEKFQPSDPTE
jgi:hypothetical protein